MKCACCQQGEGKYVKYLRRGYQLVCLDCFLPIAGLQNGKAIGFTADKEVALEEYFRGCEVTPEMYWQLIEFQHFGV